MIIQKIGDSKLYRYPANGNKTLDISGFIIKESEIQYITWLLKEDVDKNYANSYIYILLNNGDKIRIVGETKKYLKGLIRDKKLEQLLDE